MSRLVGQSAPPRQVKSSNLISSRPSSNASSSGVGPLHRCFLCNDVMIPRLFHAPKEQRTCGTCKKVACCDCYKAHLFAAPNNSNHSLQGKPQQHRSIFGAVTSKLQELKNGSGGKVSGTSKRFECPLCAEDHAQRALSLQPGYCAVCATVTLARPAITLRTLLLREGRHRNVFTVIAEFLFVAGEADRRCGDLIRSLSCYRTLINTAAFSPLRGTSKRPLLALDDEEGSPRAAVPDYSTALAMDAEVLVKALFPEEVESHISSEAVRKPSSRRVVDVSPRPTRQRVALGAISSHSVNRRPPVGTPKTPSCVIGTSPRREAPSVASKAPSCNGSWTARSTVGRQVREAGVTPPPPTRGGGTTFLTPKPFAEENGRLAVRRLKMVSVSPVMVPRHIPSSSSKQRQAPPAVSPMQNAFVRTDSVASCIRTDD